MGSEIKHDNNKKNDEEEEVILPGFRFHPTDEEIVGFYLRRKSENKPISLQLIKQIDIYKYDPWELPKVSSVVGENNKEWYFFCKRGRKYKNSIRPNRVTGSGFWKATGIDRPIYSSSSELIGLKKSLVYYSGSAGKGTKTDWMMHEFRLPPNPKITYVSLDQQVEVWTLCRIFKRIPTNKKYNPVDSKQKTIKTNISDSSEKHVLNNFGDSSSSSSSIERSQLFYQQFNPNGDDFFANGNWDELRTVVDLAIDPSYPPQS